MTAGRPEVTRAASGYAGATLPPAKYTRAVVKGGPVSVQKGVAALSGVRGSLEYSAAGADGGGIHNVFPLHWRGDVG
jgi:hypothetical protein